MIKVAVINLGKNVYSAFTLNQEQPLATVYRGSWTDSKDDIERVLIERFHSQRNKYKADGISIPPLVKDNRRVGWKFIWKNTSSIWEKEVEPKPEIETLVSEPGLTITRQKPLADIAADAAKKLEPMYIAKRLEHGFSFEPVSEDIIAESEIPTYMRNHRA